MTPEQLKASILQYAMEGKLVKQDPNDEPASELVKKIENEKNQLVEEGKIKKGRKTGAIAENEKPFDIPNSWSWIRLNAIANDIGDGLHGTPEYTSNGEYSFINGSNLKSGSISLVNAKHIDKAEYEKIKINLDKKSILISLNGTLGNLAKYNNEKVALGKSAGYVVLTNNLVFDYIYVFLESPVFKSFYTQNYTGTTIKNIPLKALRNCPIPLPPIEEQKRIVAKIEKLMPLVDEYAESYNRLQKIDNEFEDKLKQSVLQYAMEGKLVKQNPSDEPASELVKASSMEKSHNESYKIPSSWEWIRLGSGVKFINGRAYKKTELLTDSNLTPVLRVGNLFTNSSWYYSDLKLDEDKYIDNGDLIYAWSASFGPRIWNGGHVIYHYHIWKTVIKKSIDKKFLYYFLSDPHNVLGETKLHGSTMKHVTKTNMEKLPFPLPPLEEQKRIVAKIEKIMNSINNH